jgi:hypothetical protein
VSSFTGAAYGTRSPGRAGRQAATRRSRSVWCPAGQGAAAGRQQAARRLDGGDNPLWLLRLPAESVAALLRAGVPALACCSARMSRRDRVLEDRGVAPDRRPVPGAGLGTPPSQRGKAAAPAAPPAAVGDDRPGPGGLRGGPAHRPGPSQALRAAPGRHLPAGRAPGRRRTEVAAGGEGPGHSAAPLPTYRRPPRCDTLHQPRRPQPAARTRAPETPSGVASFRPPGRGAHARSRRRPPHHRGPADLPAAAGRPRPRRRAVRRGAARRARPGQALRAAAAGRAGAAIAPRCRRGARPPFRPRPGAGRERVKAFGGGGGGGAGRRPGGTWRRPGRSGWPRSSATPSA